MSWKDVRSEARLWTGDALAGLRTLPDASVQCCVTSPPYYGLRDYGTGTWEGGDPACEHGVRHWDGPKQTQGAQSGHASAADRLARSVCRCGAVCVDQQIGLEETPDAYVARLVEVFREVRRILRDDGVLFLNLGDSYYARHSNHENTGLAQKSEGGKQRHSIVRPQSYRLRDDLTENEKCHVAMEMFGVRIGEDETPSQGSVPEVLPKGDEGTSLCVRPGVEGERVESQLSAQQGESAGINEGEAAATEVDGHREAGREVRVLRGDNAGVFDRGSHQRRRGCAPEGVDGKEPCEQREDIQGHSQPGISEGQVSGAMLQLQLRDRVLGILSAHTYTADEIPDSARFAFVPVVTLKPKDIVGIPWMVAFALRADGWYLRQDILWNKKNCMPESVTDRCTKSHEYVFLLAKRERYFFDAVAIQEVAVCDRKRGPALHGDLVSTNGNAGLSRRDLSDTRNRRSVWTLATESCAEAHFAVMPSALADLCIRAGTSEQGACAECGSPWRRRLADRDKVGTIDCEGKWQGEAAQSSGRRILARMNAARKAVAAHDAPFQGRATVGWEPSCGCVGTEQVPCTVIDPFTGSGTTGIVALRQDRRFVGCELNAEYAKMAARRIAAVEIQLALL